MAKKIQVSTIRQMADVQVINVSSRLVCLAVEAQIKLKALLDDATSPNKQWSDETNQWEKQKDENGNIIMTTGPIDGKEVSENVMPFLDELVEALKGGE